MLKASCMMPFDTKFIGSAMTLKTQQWQGRVKGILKGELKRRNLSYADLAERLTTIGVPYNELNIKNKIGRGTFSAIFFIQCMAAIDCHTIHLDDMSPQ